MFLKIFIISVFTVFGLWLLRSRKTARVRAWQKLIIILFVLNVILVTLSPKIAGNIASFFGFTRATDIIVYATIVLFLFVTANIYLKFQDLTSQLVKVARLAVIEQGLKKFPNWNKEE